MSITKYAKAARQERHSSFKTALLLSSLAIGAGLLFSAAQEARGATPVTNTFQVTATITSSCTVSGSNLNFGSAIDPLAAGVPLDASSNLTVSCSNSTPYSVSLNAGANAGGTANFTSRAMISGGNSLAYQLYLDSGRSSVWGDGTSSSATKSGTGTGSAQTIPVYGRIPSLANVVPGSYTDTVTVTVSY